MSEPKDTKAYIHKETLAEIGNRAKIFKRPKTDLFKLLTLIPLEILRELVEKYLTKKHPPTP